jgi:transposase InsO family protein
MDDVKRLEIATFRYGVIAPVLHSDGTGQMEYFRKMATRQLDVPHVGLRQYAPGTLKSWLRCYRRHGLDGLMPKRRSDAGTQRVITPEMSLRIGQILTEHPRMSVAHLREMLIDEGLVTSNRASVTTIRRHIRSEGLRPASEAPPTARKRFEKPQANDLWTLDFMHGPRVRGPRRTRLKTYLAAAIDDHSRYLPLGVFLPTETYPALASALKVAFLRHGLPKTLYCDNGSAFSSADLALACARLGVALVHSKPYDSPSRGKIERFFGTVRSRFLAVVDLDEMTSLERLNSLFDEWLEHDYHRRVHSAIKERPLDRYMRSLASSRTRKISREELDLVFYRTLNRKVRADCTVSIAGRLFEAPADWIGSTVEIRHPLDEPDQLYIFVGGRPICPLRPVNLAENAATAKPIRFSLFDDEEEP